MKTSFTRCNECVVYHNWHHMGDWKKRFVKIVTGDFVDVPRKFLANNIRGEIPDEVDLDVPNGKTYTIQVSEEENGLVFKSGWAEFARTYELVQGDILLFESSGSSCFQVRIFNQTGCEKELSCVNEKSMPCDNHMQSPRNERCGNMMGKCHTICKVCAAFYYWHHMDKMRFFMVMMGVNASKNGLTVPKEFANNVRGQISEEVKLEVPDGQTYRVQVDKEPNEVVLRSGWDAFVSAYELKDGDTLLFGYTGNSHFKVRIFNVSGCDKLLSCVSGNSILSNKSSKNLKNSTLCVQQWSAGHNNSVQSPRESMKKLCTVCLECVDRHYWHMKDHDWCFVKVMSLSNFKDEMAIPVEFTANFRGYISDEVKLEVADGSIYNVQVAQEQDKFILRKGWVDFTGAYDLKQHDFLFFIYIGDSHFKVRILKPSGCEKALSCVTMSCGPEVQERDICHDLSLPSKKRCRNDGLTDSWKTTNIAPTGSPSQKSSSEMNTQDVTSSEDIQEARGSGGLRGSTKSRYILEKGCILTSSQKARVDTFVKESWTGIQFYVTAMNEKSLSDGYLVICKDYAADHLPHQDQTIKLCYSLNSKTWDANLAVISDGACTISCILAAGWLDFVRDNNLQEGDICAFEVSKGHDRVIITVHLLKNVVITGHTKTTSQQKKKWTHPGYVVTKYTKLTCKQKTKVEERIQAIKPETRIFVSIMHKCRAKLYIELRYATDHLPREGQWMRLQLPGKNRTWEAKLCIRDKGNASKSYELTTGWRNFVDDNKLQDDDMCLFELIKNEEELTINVHIIRGD